MVTAIRPLWEMFKRLPLARVNRSPSIDPKTRETKQTQPVGLHSGSRADPSAAIQTHESGLQNGCRRPGFRYAQVGPNPRQEARDTLRVPRYCLVRPSAQMTVPEGAGVILLPRMDAGAMDACGGRAQTDGALATRG